MTRHSLATLAIALTAAWSIGCGETKPNMPAKPNTPAAGTPAAGGAEDHSHGAGPHKGVIADMAGGKYHIEFTVDHPKKEAVVYILGGDGKTPAPIKTDKLTLTIIDPKFDVELTPLPQDGEVDGMSSRFAGTHDNLGKVQEFAGSVTTEVDGTPYSADFKEEAGHDHDHEHGNGEKHDHDHDHDKDKDEKMEK